MFVHLFEVIGFVGGVGMALFGLVLCKAGVPDPLLAEMHESDAVILTAKGDHDMALKAAMYADEARMGDWFLLRLSKFLIFGGLILFIFTGLALLF